MRNVTSCFSLAAAAVLALFLASCNATGNPAGIAYNPVTGSHPANWTTAHAAAYTANPAQCTPCHGSATVLPATTPQSGVTCFGCHHPNGLVANRPIWDIGHAAAYTTNAAQCVQCHGSATTQPATAPTSGVTCFGCHHPGGPTLASASTANWTLTHWQNYSQNPSACVGCHGTANALPTTTPSSGVTCFNCHHPDGPSHAAGWGGTGSSAPIPPHGAAAILPVSGAFNLGSPVFPDPLSGLTGMASCVPCHGPLYKGTDVTGTVANNVAAGGAPSCYACHATAPHPPAPWGAGLGLPATQPNHDQVDPSNATECAKCHILGANTNPPITPVVPAPAGTAPGCFNGTLCHSKSFN